MIAEAFNPKPIRTFETGATKSSNEGKLCYDGFFSPVVMLRRAQYMHKCRLQEDGAIREPDNWQKGISKEAYMESMFRHFMDVWLYIRGKQELMTEDIETALCALSFNSDGMLFEILKEK